MLRKPLRLLGLCLLLPGIASAWQDPLSGAEEAAAVSLALSDSLSNPSEETSEGTTNNKTGITLQARQASQSGQPALFNESDGFSENGLSTVTLDKEILLVELLYQKRKKNVATQTALPRIAEVFMFDYDSGETSRYEIDLDTDCCFSSGK